jgi:hypothetical protein
MFEGDEESMEPFEHLTSSIFEWSPLWHTILTYHLDIWHVYFDILPVIFLSDMYYHILSESIWDFFVHLLSHSILLMAYGFALTPSQSCDGMPGVLPSHGRVRNNKGNKVHIWLDNWCLSFQTVSILSPCQQLSMRCDFSIRLEWPW